MADSDFGLKIGIEGEREFKAALKDINQQFKVLGSEMKLVESQFDKQDRSVSALTSRNEVLTRQIAEQKEKIELLRRALENSAESFGENDQRTKQWTVQLNNAQARCVKLTIATGFQCAKYSAEDRFVPVDEQKRLSRPCALCVR